LRISCTVLHPSGHRDKRMTLLSNLLLDCAAGANHIQKYFVTLQIGHSEVHLLLMSLAYLHP